MIAGTPSIGAIVLNWNRAADTLACLHMIAEWQPVPVTWVVDNGSTGGAALPDATFPGVRLIRSSINLGFAGGNNLALRQALEAGCDFVLLLNNDAWLAQADLDRLVEAMRSDPSIGVIGPVLRDRQPPHRLLSAGGRDIARYVLSHDLELPPDGRLKDVTYVPGTVALLRATLLERIGLLDERYFFGGEVADLCERARAAGSRSVIHAGAQALHDLDRSSQLRDSLHAYYVFRNRFLFIRKFRAERKTRLFLVWIARGGGMTLAALVRGRFRRARAIGLGVWHGLTGQYGGRNEQVWPELKTAR